MSGGKVISGGGVPPLERTGVVEAPPVDVVVVVYDVDVVVVVEEADVVASFPGNGVESWVWRRRMALGWILIWYGDWMIRPETGTTPKVEGRRIFRRWIFIVSWLFVSYRFCWRRQPCHRKVTTLSQKSIIPLSSKRYGTCTKNLSYYIMMIFVFICQIFLWMLLDEKYKASKIKKIKYAWYFSF